MHAERYLYRYGKLAAAAGIAVSFFAQGAAAQVGLGLAPMRLEVKVVPGTERSGSLTLTNDSPGPVRFRTEIFDFTLDQDAVPQFEKDIPAESQYSCRQWMTFNPMEGNVPAASSTPVRYTLRVPAGIPSRTYHCAVGFASLAPIRPPQEQAMGVSAQIQMITAFYLTVGDPKQTGELKEIEVQKIDDPKSSGLRAVFKVENDGFSNLRGSGTVDVLDASGKAVETMQFPAAVILPQRTQLLPLVLPEKLADGDYTIRARVNLGTGEIQEATLGFRPPPATSTAK